MCRPLERYCTAADKCSGPSKTCSLVDYRITIAALITFALISFVAAYGTKYGSTPESWATPALYSFVSLSAIYGILSTMQYNRDNQKGFFLMRITTVMLISLFSGLALGGVLPSISTTTGISAVGIVAGMLTIGVLPLTRASRLACEEQARRLRNT
ncbi:MAG: hypothetical protein ACKVOH_06775 [Chlamydiales bacterium]